MSLTRAETLLVSSVEGLLDDEECAFALREIDAVLAAGGGALAAGAAGRSIHAIEGLTVADTVGVYEPAGRIEIDRPPPSVTTLADGAVRRRLDDLVRVAPGIEGIDDWVYLEYGPGQFVTSHVDYPQNAERPDRPKVLGISIQLNDDFGGGEFYVETSTAAELWREGAAGLEIGDNANNHSAWFRALPRTQWSTRARRGSALLYGTRLVHGTRPVTWGRSRKLIGWLLSTWQGEGR